MKQLSVVLLALVLVAAACSSTGEVPPSPLTALSQTSSLDAGSGGIIGSIMVGGVFPLNYPMKFQGHGTLTWQYPAQPYVIIDGEILVEPIFPYVEETRQAIREGRLVIRQKGKPQGLVPVGTINLE